MKNTWLYTVIARKCQDETSYLHFLVLKVLQSLDNPLSISDYLIMMKHLDKPIHFYTYTCVEARALIFFLIQNI